MPKIEVETGDILVAMRLAVVNGARKIFLSKEDFDRMVDALESQSDDHKKVVDTARLTGSFRRDGCLFDSGEVQ